MSDDSLSSKSMLSATKSRASFSSHGNAKGAAGFRDLSKCIEDCDFIEKSGDSLTISSPDNGFDDINIGCSWDNISHKVKADGENIITRLFKRTRIINKGIDLDLGCLYELFDGSRGALQAFGKRHGNYEDSPYIFLSEDEKKGDKEGNDEYLRINGQKWNEIKRILVYAYIYDGVQDWASVSPKIQLVVKNENPMVVTLDTYRDDLDICAIASIENIRNGIKLTNHTEYFHGHAEMDRAFGFGLDWDDGFKQ